MMLFRSICIKEEKTNDYFKGTKERHGDQA